MRAVSAETDVSITKLPPTPPPQMISQMTETDSSIMKLPPTPVEVNSQASETDRCITKIPPTIPEMKPASTEMDRAITNLPETKVKEIGITFQCSLMQTEEVANGINEVKTNSTHTDVKDEMIQTEVDKSNILTVNKIEIVYSMESWGTQTDVVELEDMSPIRPINQCQKKTETTLSSDDSPVVWEDEANGNSKPEFHTGVTVKHNEEFKADSSLKEEFDPHVNTDESQANSVNEGTIPDEPVFNPLTEIEVPDTDYNVDADEVVNPELADSVHETEVFVHQKCDDGDVSDVVSNVNPTNTPDHSETESIVSSILKSEEFQST